jgi:hypothetical protein
VHSRTGERQISHHPDEGNAELTNHVQGFAKGCLHVTTFVAEVFEQLVGLEKNQL